MNFEGNFRKLGEYDVSDILRTLQSKVEKEWLDTVATDKGSHVHRHSRGVFLKNDIRPEHLYGTIRPAYPEFEEVLSPLLDYVASKIGGGYFIRLQFSRHLPGFGFDPHTDNFSFTLRHAHRIHLPIISNPGVWFSVGEERSHLGIGQLWEINNTRRHAGGNDGTTQRVHMILDFAPPLANAARRATYLSNHYMVSGRGLLLCRPRLDTDEAVGLAEGDSCGKSTTVGPQSVVSIRYRVVEAETGRVLEEDSSEEPLAYCHGNGQLPSALEKALAGLEAGGRFSVTLAPNEGYGEQTGRHLSSSELGIPQELAHYRMAVAEDRGAVAMLFADGPVLTGGPAVPGALRTFATDHPFAGRYLRVEGEVRSVRKLDPREARHARALGALLVAPNQAWDVVARASRGRVSEEVVGITGQGKQPLLLVATPQ